MGEHLMSGELRKRLAGIAGQLSVRLSRYADRLCPPYPRRGETTHGEPIGKNPEETPDRYGEAQDRACRDPRCRRARAQAAIERESE